MAQPRRSTPREDFNTVITDAVEDFTRRGFVAQSQLDEWMERIRDAAERSLVPERQIDAEIRRVLTSAFQRQVTRGAVLKLHKGVSTFRLQQLRPKLHAELQRRIMANAALIKINRAQAVDTTVKRFAGWASAQQPGGSRAVDKIEQKQTIRKALAQLPFEERRVAIDQGHKFVSSLNDIIANDAGAIAMIWHSHWRQKGYDYREDHKERDKNVYAIRNNWAIKKGLMKRGPNPYSDEITAPAEEVFCRCYAEYLYSIDDLPDYMQTERGRHASNHADNVMASFA